MNVAEWNSLTAGCEPLPEPLVERCHEAARQSRARETAAYSGFSGADLADAPAHGLTADLFCLAAAGADREKAAQWARDRWLAYAREQRARVEQAPKIKRGPRQGQSVIEHKWVSDEFIEDKIRFVFSCLKAWA